MGHLFRQFCFDGLEVETRALLHRRVVEEGLQFLAHHLLDEAAGRAHVWVSHDPQQALRVAGRRVRMRAGRLEGEG